MKNKADIIGGLIVLTLALGLTIFLHTNRNAATNLDTHDKQLLDNVKFQNVFQLTRGFYNGCMFTVEERKDYWHFSGTIGGCIQNPYIEVYHITVNAHDFIDGLETGL